MSLSFQINIAIVLAALAPLVGCGVEAGNPSTKKPTGMINISFLQSLGAGSESLSIPIDGLFLAQSSSDGTSLAEQALSIKTSDLALITGAESESTSTTSGSIELSSGEVEEGVYSGVVIQLPSDRHPRYRPPGGTEDDLGIDAIQNRQFVIQQEISVTADTTTSVVLRIDALGSLMKKGDGPYQFNPKGGAFGGPPLAHYSGKTEIAGARWVCAYGYGLMPPPPPAGPRGPDGNRQMGGMAPPPQDGMAPPRRGNMRPHVQFQTREEIVFDTTSSCENAFSKVSVFETNFTLDHLPTGSYALRIFKVDETYQDEAVDISVKSP